VGVDPTRHLRRLSGAALLAAVTLPLYRLLDPATTGAAGAVTRATGEAVWELTLLGTITVGALAALLAWRAPVGALERALTTVGSHIGRWPARRFAAALGLVAGGLSLWIARSVLRGRPTLVDEMVQLLHARVLAGGDTALPLPDPAAAWMVQNSLLTPAGWASVYPPGHTLLLAGALRAGAPWLVGPVMVAITAGFSALVADRVLVGRALARTAAIAAALSPFVLFLGSGYLSHATAGAMAAVALWAALHARDGSAWWAVVSGAAGGVMVCARPWTGLVLGAALIAAAWLPTGATLPARGRRWLLRRVGALIMGGLPFALLLFRWNDGLFGGPLTLGYGAAFGPAHGLGFHADPWGNAYGPIEAVAYSATDVLQLGLQLFETPLPVTLFVALWWMAGSRRVRGAGVLAAWALAPVAANFAYWHHGIHMGPRFLYEAAPAWAMLALVAVAGVARDARLPSLLRRGVLWAAVLALAGGALSLPGRAASYRPTSSAREASMLPDPPRHPALVLVHGSWASRMSARLAAAGMRRDSIETALSRNDLCEVARYASWRERPGRAPPPTLERSPLPGTPSSLRLVEISPGNRIRVRPGVRPPDACLREAASDRAGTLELEPLLWQAPLPRPRASLVLARDLGPEENRRTIQSFPERCVYLYVDDEGTPRLLAYGEGMRRLWGTDGLGAGATAVSGPREPRATAPDRCGFPSDR